VLAMAYGTHQPEWLATTLPEQRAQLNSLVLLESEATRVTQVAPLLVLGFLQTSDYIQSIMVAARVPQTEIATRIAVRIGRRDVITRRDPAHLTAILGEAALRQVIGSRKIMIAQLRYLLELAGHPNVDLRVAPYASGWHPGLEGVFNLIESDANRAVVYIEM